MKLKKVKTTGVLLGGALACSLLPQGHIASAADEIIEPIVIKANYSDNDDSAIKFTTDGDNLKKYCDLQNDLNISGISTTEGSKNASLVLFSLDSGSNYNTFLNLLGNVNINAGYGKNAIYTTKGNEGTANLTVNSDGSKTVKIIGDVIAGADSTITLTLNNANSYLAGKFKKTSDNYIYPKPVLELHNKATWYVPVDTEITGDSTDTVTLDMHPDSGSETLHLDGGILDFSHTTPNSISTTIKNVNLTRYNGYDANVSQESALNETTFRINSDMKNNSATKVAFAIDPIYQSAPTINKNETYFLQVAYDPNLKSNSALLSEGKGQAVFDLNHLKLENNSKATVTPQKYDKGIGEGSQTMSILPVLAYDKDDNTYYLVALISDGSTNDINELDRNEPINIDYKANYNYADKVLFNADKNEADLSGNLTATGAKSDSDATVKFFTTKYGSSAYTALLSLTGDVDVNNSGATYALHTKGDKTDKQAYTILKVNPNKNKTVKITGNVFAEENSAIHLYLNNEASYFAGEFKADASNITGETSTFDLHDKATWYVPSDVTKLDMNNANLKLNLSGGILDFAHTGPGPYTSSDNKDSGRTGNVNISDYTGNGGNSGLNNATFIIKGTTTTGENGTSIVFSGDSILKEEETYKFLLSYAPNVNINQILAALQNGQVVFDLSGLTNKDKATIIGGIYNQSINSGLDSISVETDVIPDDNGNYIIKLKSKDNGGGNVTTSDGPAMQMAKSAGVAAQAMLAAARADNNDLMRRMGDLRNNEGEAGAWVRYYSGESDVKLGNKTKVRYNAVQGGYDKKFDLKDGRLFAGIAISHTDSDFSFSEGAGDADTTLFGVYGSYVGNKGHFADMIFKYGRMGSDFATYSGGDHYSGSSSANMMSLAAEYGYRLKLKGNWYMEPQAELTYGYVGGDDYTMTMNGGTGAHVSADASKSLIGRLGITLGRKVDTSSVYAKLSLCHEFDGDMDLTATYGGTVKPYHESLKDTWVEYGLGFNTKVGPDVNLYGELEKSTGSAIENKWRANVGLRYAF